MAKTVLYTEAKTGSAQLVLFNMSGFIGSYQLGLLTTIGRMSNSVRNDIALSSPIVSRNHGEFALVNGQYFYRDCGSANGTYINKNHYGKTEPEQATPLKNGDIFRIDLPQGELHHPDFVFGFFTTSKKAMRSFGKIQLGVQMAEIMIGRNAGSGMQIQDDMISESHASFFNSKSGWAILDHKSTNGVYLNGKKMTYPHYLNPFDIVRIVNNYFIYTGDCIYYSSDVLLSDGDIKIEEPSATENNPEQKKQGRASKQLVINIVERSVVQRFKKLMLLQDINISVSNGEMVLILGGSGAGKTTFINAVMGYEKAAGKIVYNNTDIYEEYEQMKYEIGFVPQQDLLRGSDSVYDTLSNSAEMKLPRSVTAAAREKRIAEVLEELGLSREKDSLVSKLSGGQRKRLSIAVELIANPSLFFLDEPDSGIDDIMGRGLMENLRNIADSGKIIMVITHSPERAADLFDKVIVLAKSTKDNCGHLAFFGNVKEAFSFFEVKSFREIVKKINRPDENGEGLSDFFIEKYNSDKRQRI